MTDEIRFIGDMQRLQPQPGDVFVLSCEQRVDRATAERIKAELSGQLGGATVLVLDSGAKLGVVARLPDDVQSTREAVIASIRRRFA